MATYNVSASSSIQLRGTPGASLGVIRVFASASMSFSATAPASAIRTVPVLATAGMRWRSSTIPGAARTVSVVARADAGLGSKLDLAVSRTVSVSAFGLFAVSGSPLPAGLRQVSAWAGVALSGRASNTLERNVSATSTARIGVSLTKTREISTVATVSMSLAVDEPANNQFLSASASAAQRFLATASAVKGGRDVVARVGFSSRAYASVVTGDGDGIAGGDSSSGLRRLAYGPCSGEFPFSFAETTSGVLLLANGVDPMLRWDGLLAKAEPAGVRAPDRPVALAGGDIGTLTGTRYAAIRYIDRAGNPSALSPISNAVDFGRDGAIQDVSAASGQVVITSPHHGLATGEVVIIGGVGGAPANGEWPVYVLDADRFALPIAAQSVSGWTGGGWWTWGIAFVAYQSLAKPAEDKVVRRQILRTLDGDASVFYVDIDTTDLTSDVLLSSRDDDSLAGQEAVPLLGADDMPYAARFAPPPNHKSIVHNHLGRVFAAGEASITRGNAAASPGSDKVQGIGTDWPASVSGRFFYLPGATRPYEIASCNPATQVLTLTEPYRDQGTTHDGYAIRSAPAERKVVYYSEPAQPEAWPPWNAFAVPDDSDEVVGLSSREGILWILERRHIYRFTHQDDPSQGSCFLVAYRGAINNRCVVQADDAAYILDEAGIYAFSGGQCDPISTPIQSVFRPGGDDTGMAVDWSADTTLWHAVHDPTRDLIRWFVRMVGDEGIRHAICYETRRKRWWVERYPFEATASCTGNLAARRALVGSTARRVLCLGEGSADLVADGQAIRGRVVSADLVSLTDPAASFPPTLVGAPVSIVGGTGAGQQRVIAATSATELAIVQPWDVAPDATSVYQVGGVDWALRTGWFEYAHEQEQGNNRDIAIVYKPTDSEAEVVLRVYHDHGDAEAWSLPLEQDGVYVEAGSDRVVFDLRRRASRSGWSQFRNESHSESFAFGPLWVSIGLSGTQGPEPIRVHHVQINGARGGDQ